MTPEQRDAVRENARYLRSVRPIDPEEIHEYVEGRPHPAAVRQVIRESASDLNLIEREDGRFVPVGDEPVPAPDLPVERFPERLARRLEDFLVEHYGPGWPEGGTGDRLRSRIRDLKERYYRGRDVEYDAEAAAGYAIYHLSDYYAAVQYVLGDLTDPGLLGRNLRILDVGAGVGGPALGLHDALPRDALVEYHGLEPSPAAEVLESLLAETGPNFHPTVRRDRAESFEPEGEYDLVVFANVLSELPDPAGTVERYADALAPEGSVLALAPADRETSTGLRAVERAVDLPVYSPTVRLWPDAEPEGECWSFDVRPDLDVPAFQRRLDEQAGDTGEFVNVDVQFSYAVLRPDGTRRVEFTPDPDRFARMADAEAYVTERVDLAAVKLSHDLSEGDNPLFLVGDGSERVDHFGVLVRETSLNRALREADYGAVLILEGTLALWNDDEGAYNLVVDEETVVDPVG